MHKVVIIEAEEVQVVTHAVCRCVCRCVCVCVYYKSHVHMHVIMCIYNSRIFKNKVTEAGID